MKDDSIVSADKRIAARRGFLAGGLGAGITAVTAAITSASAHAERHNRPERGSDSSNVAPGGIIHTQLHGGDTTRMTR